MSGEDKKDRKLGAFYTDNGIVADHLIAGSGPDVARIFGSDRVNISQGYPSQKYGQKDRVTKSADTDDDFQVDDMLLKLRRIVTDKTCETRDQPNR